MQSLFQPEADPPRAEPVAYRLLPVKKSLLPVAFCLLPFLLSSCRHYPRVIVSTKGGNEIVVRVEVANTPAKRELGLQYRQELADGEGMLFLFPSEGPKSFWMKNTPISLDLIFMGSQGRIVGIIHEAVPFSTAPLSVAAPSQFVLEVKGGLSRRKGIAIGDTVRFEGISLKQIKE